MNFKLVGQDLKMRVGRILTGLSELVLPKSIQARIASEEAAKRSVAWAPSSSVPSSEPLGHAYREDRFT
mgnify:CR=1 FL=1